MKVSVVIPTYNRCALALQAVESVVRQTFPAHEIIVVVDGSTDDTGQSIVQRFPSAIVLQCPNRGLAISRNRGLAEASGDWIAFLDDDDLWHPKKLESAAQYLNDEPACEAMNNPHWYFSETAQGPIERIGNARDLVGVDLDALIVSAEKLGLRDDLAAARLDSRGDSFTTYLRRDRGVISSVVVRRETLIRAGGSCPSQVCNEDWTLFLNVARLTEWHTLPYKLGFTRFHENQMTNPEPVEMLFSLVNLINAWMSGRPMLQRTSREDVRRALASYGPVYRQMIANFYWTALKLGDLALFMKLRCAAQILLPRWSDRTLAYVPPPITWRWKRLLGEIL